VGTARPAGAASFRDGVEKTGLVFGEHEHDVLRRAVQRPHEVTGGIVGSMTVWSTTAMGSPQAERCPGLRR
jgi:hypothetical protein